jgi:hypothetical protein
MFPVTDSIFYDPVYCMPDGKMLSSWINSVDIIVEVSCSFDCCVDRYIKTNTWEKIQHNKNNSNLMSKNHTYLMSVFKHKLASIFLLVSKQAKNTGPTQEGK